MTKIEQLCINIGLATQGTGNYLRSDYTEG
jgi:hypothetical protein